MTFQKRQYHDYVLLTNADDIKSENTVFQILVIKISQNLQTVHLILGGSIIVLNLIAFYS